MATKGLHQFVGITLLLIILYHFIYAISSYIIIILLLHYISVEHQGKP